MYPIIRQPGRVLSLKLKYMVIARPVLFIKWLNIQRIISHKAIKVYELLLSDHGYTRVYPRYHIPMSFILQLYMCLVQNPYITLKSQYLGRFNLPLDLTGIIRPLWCLSLFIHTVMLRFN